MTLLKNFFRNIVFFLYYRWWSLFNLFYPKQRRVKEQTLQEKSVRFIEDNKENFIKNAENLPISKNDNIDPIFYNKKQFQEMISNPNNPIETVWKKRILFQSSPRGNIIMYYDPYKLGFSYYSDQTVSYDILNVYAMRYVKMFSCYDFFLDECITIVPSPLLKLLEEDKKENLEKKEVKSILKNAPFAKFKTYNKAESKVKDTEEKREPELIKQRNKFMNLGRLSNFSFLQKIEKKKQMDFSNGKDSFGIFENTNQEVISYQDFKRMKTK